jgi:hypothetical protein
VSTFKKLLFSAIAMKLSVCILRLSLRVYDEGLLENIGWEKFSVREASHI